MHYYSINEIKDINLLLSNKDSNSKLNLLIELILKANKMLIINKVLNIKEKPAQVLSFLGQCYSFQCNAIRNIYSFI